MEKYQEKYEEWCNNPIFDEETKKELFGLRMKQSTGTLDKPSRIKELRKDVARMKTILKERELAGGNTDGE